MELTSKRVLLVDDDVVFNFLHRRMIEHTHLAREISVTLTGREAIEYLQELPVNAYPDVIVLDLSMPVMDGFEFIRAFRKLPTNHNTRIVIITSSGNPRDHEQLEQMGMDCVLTKPVSIQQLKAVLV